MTPREIALALAVTTVVADAAAEAKDRLRAQLLASLDQLGADSVRAELPDGTRVAKSSLTAPAPKPSVVDEASFTAHVAATSPHNVEQRLIVRPAFQRTYLDSLVSGADGAAFDPATGEVVPGVAFRKGSPFMSTRFEKEGRAAVLDALRAGRVSLDMSAPAELVGGEA